MTDGNVSKVTYVVSSIHEKVKNLKLCTNNARRTLDNARRRMKSNCNMSSEWLRLSKNAQIQSHILYII